MKNIKTLLNIILFFLPKDVPVIDICATKYNEFTYKLLNISNVFSKILERTAAAEAGLFVKQEIRFTNLFSSAFGASQDCLRSIKRRYVMTDVKRKNEECKKKYKHDYDEKLKKIENDLKDLKSGVSECAGKVRSY